MTTSASTLVRDARVRAGLSQVEFAKRAGIDQSVVSAYETGRRKPSFDMMTKLLGAAGASIVIEYVPAESARALPDTPRARKLLSHRQEILDVVRDAGGTNVRVFGSVARGDDGAESDIDLLVDSPHDFSLFEIGGLIADLSHLLGERVDIVPARSLPDQVHNSAGKDAIAL